jgi:hypothetical protein
VTACTPVPLEYLRDRAGGKGLLQLGTLYAYAAIRTGGDPDALAQIVQEVQDRAGSEGLFAFLTMTAHTAAVFAEAYAEVACGDLDALLDSFEMDALRGLPAGGDQ